MTNWHTRVTRMTVDTNEYGGVDVEVTIRRVPNVALEPNPRVTDLPPGVLEALMQWLEGQDA